MLTVLGSKPRGKALTTYNIMVMLGVTCAALVEAWQVVVLHAVGAVIGPAGSANTNPTAATLLPA